MANKAVNEKDRVALLNNPALKAHFDIMCKLFDEHGAKYNETLIVELARESYENFLKRQQLEHRLGSTFDPDMVVIQSQEILLDAQKKSFKCENGQTLVNIPFITGTIEMSEVARLEACCGLQIPKERRVRIIITGETEEIKLTPQGEKGARLSDKGNIS